VTTQLSYTTNQSFVYSFTETDAVVNERERLVAIAMLASDGTIHRIGHTVPSHHIVGSGYSANLTCASCLRWPTSRRVYCENCTKTVRQPILGGFCLYSFTNSSASFNSCMYRNACNGHTLTT